MKKLKLKKEVVARLNDDQMNQLKGGAVISQNLDCPIGPTEFPRCAELQTNDLKCKEPVLYSETSVCANCRCE
ncbi:class I lanthipeptide [uncultured Alistipes sp.]|jgi:hypothetical protein|uniref:class I lanthipeptide n=1 Tax=uncultured Alistipes sp. TaxID=538949 RepID=UPI0025E59D9B|nr:class I lanthipeptide [uncultured Alistipes sp.]